MSASFAAPVPSDETSAETAVEPVGEPTMEAVDEPMVKMRKPLRYYDRGS